MVVGSEPLHPDLAGQTPFHESCGFGFVLYILGVFGFFFFSCLAPPCSLSLGGLSSDEPCWLDFFVL